MDEIKNYKSYNYISRYETFPYFYDKDNNKYYYGLTSYLDNENASGYTIYQVKPGDSYDSIALNHYGCALFYWVILDYNRILDSLTPPTPGTTLRLPPLNSITYITG